MDFWTLQIYNSKDKSWYWLTEDLARSMHKTNKVIKDELINHNHCTLIGLKFFNSKVNALESIQYWFNYNSSGFHELRTQIPFFKNLDDLKIKPVKISFSYESEIKCNDIFFEIDLTKESIKEIILKCNLNEDDKLLKKIYIKSVKEHNQDTSISISSRFKNNLEFYSEIYEHQNEMT
jgi:hypothetical protein